MPIKDADPTKPIREAPGQSGRSYEHERRTFAGMLVLWDLSQQPANNSRAPGPGGGPSNRELKHGSLDGAHAVAFCHYDDLQLKGTIADGITREIAGRRVGGKYVTRRVMEPDNWNARFHEPLGRGNLSVWSSRLICDHTNKHNERENRSTHVIDQQNSQKWGHLSEVWWVKDVLVNTAHPELFYDSAGFLRGICDADTITGQVPRYHTCFNMNEKAGFQTDGCHIGQMDHYFILHPSTQSGTNIDGEPLVTLCERADARVWSNPNQWGPRRFFCPPLFETPGEICTGYFWWGPPGDQCMGTLAPCNDPSEDGKKIPRKTPPKNLWVFVRCPRIPDVPFPDDHRVPPGFPDKPTPSIPQPVTDNVGPAKVNRYPKTVITGQSGVVPIPDDIPQNAGLNFHINIIPAQSDPVEEPGLSTFWGFDVVVVAKGGDITPASKTAGAIVSIPDSDIAATQIEDRIVFFLKNSFINGKEGGKVYAALYRRTDLEDPSVAQRRAYVIAVFAGMGGALGAAVNLT